MDTAGLDSKVDYLSVVILASDWVTCLYDLVIIVWL